MFLLVHKRLEELGVTESLLVEASKSESVLSVELDVDHSRGDFLHHIGDEVVPVTRAVRIPVMTWEKQQKHFTVNRRKTIHITFPLTAPLTQVQTHLFSHTSISIVTARVR